MCLVCLGKDQGGEGRNLQSVSHRKWQYRNTDEHWEIEREREKREQKRKYGRATRYHQVPGSLRNPFNPGPTKTSPTKFHISKHSTK